MKSLPTNQVFAVTPPPLSVTPDPHRQAVQKREVRISQRDGDVGERGGGGGRVRCAEELRKGQVVPLRSPPSLEEMMREEERARILRRDVSHLLSRSPVVDRGAGVTLGVSLHPLCRTFS